MRSISRPLLVRLKREEREIQRRLSLLRRQRPQAARVADLPKDGSVNLFNAALEASTEQHDEVVRQRLADKSRALAEALERVHEGTYGLCRMCGCRIPRRRLEAVPTATLCVSCQAQREGVAHAA